MGDRPINDHDIHRNFCCLQNAHQWLLPIDCFMEAMECNLCFGFLPEAVEIKTQYDNNYYGLCPIYFTKR